MGKRVGQSSSTYLISMDTNPRDGGRGHPSATVWGVAVAVFWNPQGLPYATFLRPLQHPCLHLPPWVQPIAAKLLSFRDTPPPQLFFLSLEDPERETDRTRVGHGLKQKKGTWQEDESKMPMGPPHVGALHDTPVHKWELPFCCLWSGTAFCPRPGFP